MGVSGRVVEFQLAGSLGATFEGASLVDGDLGGRRPRLFLAALLREPDLTLARGQLAELLWPDELPPTWATALRVTASKVRAALGPLLQVGEADPLPATSAGYGLRLPRGVELRIDVDEAARDVREAESLLVDGRASAALDQLRGARRVLERPFLGDERGPWVERQRTELRRHLVRGIEVQGAARLALHQATAAAAAAEDAIELDPYRESAHRLLIAALLESGSKAKALRAYERCRKRLAEDGTYPSPATEALHRAILGEDPLPEEHSVPLPGRLRLVGRDEPLRELEQLLAAAAAGHGSLALVTGEAGSGKTRLLEELAARAQRSGARVLWGSSSPAEWARPFGAVVDLLPALSGLAPVELAQRLHERLVGGAEPVVDDDRLRVREDLRRAVLGAAHVAPILLVVDDLQWADDGTLAILRGLAPSVPAASVLVVAAGRDPGPPDSAVARVVAALARDPGVVRVELRPLQDAELVDLVRSVAPDASEDDVALIQAASEGNAFYAEAMVLDLVERGEAVAATAADVVAQRIGRVSAEAQSLLRTASLTEGEFELSCVVTASDLEPGAGFDALEETLATGVLVPGTRPERYAFRHELVREVVAASIPEDRAVRFHRWLAEAMEAAGPATAAEAGELAGQFHRSRSLGGGERGVPHALRAAAQATACGASDRAAAFLGMALDLLPSDDPGRSTLAAERGQALLAAARYPEGTALLVQAAEDLACSGDADAAGRLLADAAWAVERIGATPVAYELAEVGLRLVVERPDDDVWARLFLLDLRGREANDPSGIRLPVITERRRRAVRLLHDDPRFGGDMAWGVWEHRDEVLERGLDDVWALTMWAGRFHDALPLWQRQATLAEARGQLAEAVNSWAGAASCSVALGYLADAERMTDRARELARRVELHGGFALHLIGAREHLVHARASGFEDLIAWATELVDERPDRVQRWAQATRLAAIARLYAIDGLAEQARPLLDAVVAVLPDAIGAVVTANRMVSDAVGTAWLLGEARHLAVLREAVRTTIVEPDFRCPMTDPRHVQGRVLGLAGDVDGARAAFAAARLVVEDDGLRTLGPIIDHDEALLLLRAGRPDDAVPLLGVAAQLAQELGMDGWVRRVQRLGSGQPER